MSYLGILIIVFAVLWALFALMLLHNVIFTIVGIFAKKLFPPTEQKLKYGIIIGARNEERVIGALIDSIQKTDYPQDKLQIFVIAHNCTDATAEIARSKGATVYEYNNDAERTVGYAYKHIFGKINEDWGADNYDGFIIMNADNVVTENYFSKMNDAFVASGKNSVIISYRNSKNFGDNVMSCLYGIFFIASCRFESRGRTVCGCSTRVSGTGYLFRSENIRSGWEYVTLTEDWEFTADRIAKGSKVLYCDEAQFFDEQPTTLKVMLRQRLRWARGHMVVFYTRFKALMKRLFSREKPKEANKGSVYDIAVSIMPLGVMSVSLGLIQLILLALCPLFGYDPARVWTTYGIISAIGFGVSYFLTMFSGVLLVLLERKRIPKLNFFVLLGAILMWPFFLMLNIVLDVVALFVRKLEWKPIPHGERVKKAKQKVRRKNAESVPKTAE